MLVSIGEINQFLPDRVEPAIADVSDLVVTHQAFTLAKLANVYDTTQWTSEANTPKLVQAVIGMFVAGHHYNKVIADQTDDTSGYGFSLIRRAGTLLDGIYDGTLLLEDTELTFNRTLPGVHKSDPVFEMGRMF
jgi:hypothetical protein